MSAIQLEEMETIKLWGSATTDTASLRLLRTDDERTALLLSFVEAMAEAAPRLRVTREETGGSGLSAIPAIVVGKAVHYHGIPTGNELPAFLDILSWRNATDPGLDDVVRERVQGIDLPAHLKLYVTPQCHFCPNVVRLVASFAFVNPLFQVNIIDGLLFPEPAGSDGVRSVPTLILDNRLRWTGTIRTEEVLSALVHRDPSQLSAQSLESILKEGNAQRLAEMILEQRRIFPAFPDLLKHPEWSVRLGAMVVMEELANEDRSLASQVLGPLWDAMEKVDASVKGDLLYIFGMVGSAEWIPRLEGLLAHEEMADLREVLEESIETLRSRT